MTSIKESSLNSETNKYQPPGRMLDMDFKAVKKFVGENKAKITGEKITNVLLCGALLFNFENTEEKKFNSLEYWEGPLILKTDSRQLEFDSAANYFAVGIDSIKIDKIIKVENLPLNKLDQIKDIFNQKEYWDISYMFSDSIIGKTIIGIEPIEDECEGPGIIIALDSSIKIKIMNDMDWIYMLLK